MLIVLLPLVKAWPWETREHHDVGKQRCEQLALRPGAANKQWPSLVLPSVKGSAMVVMSGNGDSQQVCHQRWSQFFPITTHAAANRSFNHSFESFDVIVDCGAERPVELFGAYFAMLGPGGHYIIDDAQHASFELRNHPLLALRANNDGIDSILERCVWSWLVHGVRQVNSGDGLQASLVVRKSDARELPGTIETKAMARDDGRGANPRGQHVSTFLGALFQHHRTDKFRHRYDQSYALLFEPLYKDSVQRMMELGVGNGHCPSLRAWLDYFNTAQVYGYDKRKYNLDVDLLSQSRLTIKTNVRTRQSTRERRTTAEVDAAWVATNVPKEFDVIIDDGCHHAFCQLTALKMFWPQLRKGGLYIIEDLWTYSDGLPHHNEGFIVGAKSQPGFRSTDPQDHPLLNHSLLTEDKAARSIFRENTWSWMISGLDPMKKFVAKEQFVNGVRGYSAIMVIRKEC